MRVVTLGVPDHSIEDFQRAMGLTDDDLFILEQSYLKQQAELSALREQAVDWHTYQSKSAQKYHRLWSLAYRLIYAVCNHYELYRKYELQDCAREPDAPTMLKAAWLLAKALDLHTLPR